MTWRSLSRTRKPCLLIGASLRGATRVRAAAVADYVVGTASPVKPAVPLAAATALKEVRDADRDARPGDELLFSGACRGGAWRLPRGGPRRARPVAAVARRGERAAGWRRGFRGRRRSHDTARLSPVERREARRHAVAGNAVAAGRARGSAGASRRHRRRQGAPHRR